MFGLGVGPRFGGGNPGSGRDGGRCVGAFAEVGLLLLFEFGLDLAARCTHVPFGDHEPEQHVVENEEHQAHPDQQRDVLCGRRRAVQQEVHQPGREGEPEVDVELISDRQRQTGQNRMHDVERERHEHERELQRFGNTCEKCSESSR